MDIGYEELKELNRLSDKIIRKTCAISDIRNMYESLNTIEVNPSKLSRLNLEVGSRAIGLSLSEIPSIRALLDSACCRLEKEIQVSKDRIFEILDDAKTK